MKVITEKGTQSDSNDSERVQKHRENKQNGTTYRIISQKVTVFLPFGKNVFAKDGIVIKHDDEREIGSFLFNIIEGFSGLFMSPLVGEELKACALRKDWDAIDKCFYAILRARKEQIEPTATIVEIKRILGESQLSNSIYDSRKYLEKAQSESSLTCKSDEAKTATKCHFCKMNSASTQSSIKFCMYKILRHPKKISLGQVDYNLGKTYYTKKDINIPRCEECAAKHKKAADSRDDWTVVGISAALLSILLIYIGVTKNGSFAGAICLLVLLPTLILMLFCIFKSIKIGSKAIVVEFEKEKFPEVKRLLEQGYTFGEKPPQCD